MNKDLSITLKEVHMQKERLRARREELGMTQSDLARKIGLTSQAVSAYENGVKNANDIVLTALADALDCSADYLLGRTESPHSAYKAV